jgi:hypothetical protein
MTMLVGGIIVLVAAFAPTSANAVIPNSALVPDGPASFTLSCTGADAATANLLRATGLSPILLGATVTTNGIDSPADGDQFTLQLTWQFTLPATLAAAAVELGNPTVVQSAATLPMNAASGATGTATSTAPGPHTVSLGDGTQAVSFQEGPFDATFTRSGTGTPVVLSPGTVTTTSTAGGIALHLTCAPTDVTPLTLNDQAGPTPPSTTQPPPETLPLVAPTTAPPATTGGTSTGSGTATRTTALARTGFHAELLYLGIAMLGAGYALSLAGRRRARASVSSR